MQITDIRVRKISKEGKMKAVVSITFDNAFVVLHISDIAENNGFHRKLSFRDLIN